MAWIVLARRRKDNDPNCPPFWYTAFDNVDTNAQAKFLVGELDKFDRDAIICSPEQARALLMLSGVK